MPKKGLFSLPFMERAMARRKQQAHSEALELLKASGCFQPQEQGVARASRVRPRQALREAGSAAAGGRS